MNLESLRRDPSTDISRSADVSVIDIPSHSDAKSCNPYLSELGEIPPRSQSRLGFNHPLQPPGRRLTSESKTLKWTRCLFQKIQLADKDEREGQIPGIEETSEVRLLSPDQSLEQEDICIVDGLVSSGLDANARQFSTPPTLLSPISKLSQIYDDDNNVKHVRFDEHRVHPLSHRPPRLAHLRYDYPHRGLSRSALMHQKWFWRVRHDEWTMITTRKEAADAFGCIADLPEPFFGPRDQFSSPNPQIDSVPSRHTALDINAPIFPRTGDISALRDPYCAIIDRCFFQLPLWTIHKSLFMFDLHHRTLNLKNDPHEPQAIEKDGCDADSRISEVKRDIPQPVTEFTFPTLNSGVCTAPTARDDETGSTEDDFTLVGDDSSVTDKYSDDEGNTKGKSLELGGERIWELTWYARWETLVELVKRNRSLPPPAVKGHDYPNPHAQDVVPSPLKKKETHFLFCGGRWRVG